MKKLSNQEIADKVFKENKDANEVFVTSDGYPFTTKNAADLHATTSGKKLKVFPFTKKEEAKKETKNKETAPKKLENLKLDELKAVATKELVRYDDAVTKAQLIEGINKARASKKDK